MPTEMDDRQELLCWLTEHRAILRKYDSCSLFELAKVCLSWIDEKILYEVLSHWHVGSGLDMRFREAMGIGKELRYLEKQARPLGDQWDSLVSYLLHGKEWE